MTHLQALSDSELVERLHQLETTQQKTMAAIVAHLIEIEERRLHLRLGYSSLFDYCQRALGLSEDEAYRRMTVSRMASKWPAIVEGLEDGRLQMSGVALLKRYIDDENHAELLEFAQSASKRVIERRLAARFPQSDAAESMRAQRVTPLSAERFALQLSIGSETRAKLERALELMAHENPSRSLEAVLDRALEGLVEKLEHKRFAKTKDVGPRLNSVTRAAKERAPKERDPGHTAPAAPNRAFGNFRAGATDGARVENARAGAADGARVENARAGATDGARVENARAGAAETAKPTEPESARAGAAGRSAKCKKPRRAIPRPIRRQVFERDGAQCSFIGEHGERCVCRGALELDHVKPWALGGPGTAHNLRVLCRAHNQLVAEDWFGRARVRDAQRSKKAG